MIEHLSGSSMNAFDNDIHSFYTRYVLGEEPIYCENVINAMRFGKEYEVGLSEGIYRGWDTQRECEMIIGGYKLYGLFDFYNEGYRTVVECKTKSKWWSTKEIRSSWQFRIYNHWCWINGFEFILHEYNKKEADSKELDIRWKDENFKKDFIEKAQQIERFLKQFNIELKKYDI